MLFRARAQRNRDLFEKMFPEIKKEREDRERNDRRDRSTILVDDVGAPIKSKEEVGRGGGSGGDDSNARDRRRVLQKAIERACHVPPFVGRRPRVAFKNANTELDDQQLRSTNDK